MSNSDYYWFMWCGRPNDTDRKQHKKLMHQQYMYDTMIKTALKDAIVLQQANDKLGETVFGEPLPNPHLVELNRHIVDRNELYTRIREFYDRVGAPYTTNYYSPWVSYTVELIRSMAAMR